MVIKRSHGNTNGESTAVQVPRQHSSKPIRQVNPTIVW